MKILTTGNTSTGRIKQVKDEDITDFKITH